MVAGRPSIVQVCRDQPEGDETIRDLAHTAAVLGEQREAALALHTRRGQSGFFDVGYGERDHCCNECGSLGEYGAEWPCPTARALGVTDA